ncbi:MAG: NAD(P)/FAD-dependent oxidoreductase [Clostridiales bacterium]|nr:NAD(P)/FAD-dependent oxidoreductase [Clostridiales bacterium]
MKEIYDIVIIGAGVSGAMLAHKLSKYKLDIAVVEAGCDVASGATRANSAIVHAGFDAANGTLKAELNVKGCAELPKIAEQLDVPYKNNTSLVVGFGEEDERTLNVLLERGRNNGVPGLEIIGKEKLHELEPNIADSATAALFAPTAGIICPYELTIACAENACINGCEFFFDYKVDKIECSDGVISVFAGEREVKARYAVNCAGVHSDEVARMIDPEFPIKLIPRRGEYMILDRAEGKTCSATIFTVPSKEGKGILVSPTVDGNLLVGPNAHMVERDDTSTTTPGLDEISTGARRIVPNINLRAVITSFAGVRPTPDTDDFHIEPSAALPNFLNLVGIESPGLASSPAVADYAIGKLAGMGAELIERGDYNPFRTTDGHKRKPFRELSDTEKLELCKKDPAYGKIICRCETITEGDILDAIRRPIPARTIDMVKMRTRAGMGRCQGGFCSPRVAELIANEFGVSLDTITKRGGESKLLTGKTK